MREEKLALLLTDVVDSTKLNGDHGDAVMAEVWRQHDEGARSLMQTWRGREIGRSDGFLIVFDVVPDALEFARGYHRHLSGLGVPMQARIGIHHGPVRLRRNRDVDTERGATLYDIDGIALPVAARVMSTASARQTLLTADAVLALGAAAAEPLVSHGHWRLKGIAEPVELFEASGDGAPLVPPPDSEKSWRVVRQGHEWWPVRTLAHSLPAERDRFVGREGPLQQIAAAFDGGARLVTLAGIGGIGKTRLALCFARRWLGAWPGGAWFCDLSSARSLDGIVHAVAQGLQIELGRGDAVTHLGDAIAGRGRALIVLDNFEQVIEHGETTVGAWLQCAPQAGFAVTSREPLGIVGEQVLALPALEPTEAQALFVERVKAAGVREDYAGAEAEALPQLVDLLDRLPLALELAAARARLMPPTLLVQRMGRRFQLLASRHGRIDRQATLRATIDWSWDLLTADERSALMQLSVFEGGFDLCSAEAVVDMPGAGGDDAWVTDAVQSLVDKSLLRQSSGHRFDMLRSVHDYAVERLNGSGESLCRPVFERHWQWFAHLDERAAIANRCIEVENLVVACRRATEAGRHELAAAALLNVWAALNLTGPFNVAIAMARSLYDAAYPESMPAAMTALWVSGSALYLAGDVAAARADLVTVATWPDSGLALKARALGALGQLERSVGRLKVADELLATGLDVALEAGEPGLICRAYNASGTLRLAQGRLDEALALLNTGLETARSARDLRQQAALLGNIGVVERKRGRDESALRHYLEALGLAQAIGDRRFEGNMRSNIGLFHVVAGEPEKASIELHTALKIARATGLTRLAANVHCNLGLAQEQLGDAPGALRHHLEGVDLADRLGDAQLGGHFRIYLGRLLVRSGEAQQAADCLGEARRLLAQCTDGQLQGLLDCARAECAIAGEDLGAAERRYRRAVARTQEPGSSVGPELARELARLGAVISSR